MTTLGATRRTWLVIAACSAISLFPLLVCAASFRRLFFFHDDWFLLDGAARLGLFPWLAEPFLGEGVFPLFKLLWLGEVRLAGGDYFLLILLLWVTHAGICLLYGSLLKRFGLPLPAIAFALLIFGLASTNIETLGWSMQWNAQLAIVFFLAAWHLLPGKFKLGARSAACFLCVLASGLCSTRGILSGLVLAVFVFLRNKRSGRAPLLALCLSPAILLIAAEWLLIPHHVMAPLPALRYGVYCFILNPVFLPLPFRHGQIGVGALLLCAGLKAAVYAAALWSAQRSLRPLLWALVAFDLIFATSLGYSRWQTGIATAASSRYQYIPLLCFGPMAGILVARVRASRRVALIMICAVGVALPWKRKAEQWSTGRGAELRAAIEQAGPLDHFDPSSLTAARARELMREYELR
jgi:hypothetical protein